MTVSVGLLYSASELVRMIEEGDILGKDFPIIFPRFESVLGQTVFDFVLTMDWARFDPSGKLVISPRAKEISTFPDEEIKLRHQLYDVVKKLSLPWTTKLHFGRKEAAAAFSPDIRQIFNEAGLLNSYPDDGVVNWWDNVSILNRNLKSSNNMTTGRLGERLSMNFETQRTDIVPQWQAMESTFVGYDILSVREKGTTDQLLIEVKASVLKPKEAEFVVSRNEWGVSQRVSDYCFHLWCLGQNLRLFVIPAADIVNHIPTENGSGKWTDVKIPFKVFGSREVVLPSLSE